MARYDEGGSGAPSPGLFPLDAMRSPTPAVQTGLVLGGLAGLSQSAAANLAASYPHDPKKDARARQLTKGERNQVNSRRIQQQLWDDAQRRVAQALADHEARNARQRNKSVFRDDGMSVSSLLGGPSTSDLTGGFTHTGIGNDSELMDQRTLGLPIDWIRQSNPNASTVTNVGPLPTAPKPVAPVTPKPLKPAIEDIRRKLEAWNRLAMGLDKDKAPGADGNMGTGLPAISSSSSSTSSSDNTLSIGLNDNIGFPWLLVKDPKSGELITENVAATFVKLNAEALRDPIKAGRLMYAMTVLRMYGGGKEAYVKDRMYNKKGPEGKMEFAGTWGEDDRNAVSNLIKMMSHDQSNLIEAALNSPDPSAATDALPDFETLITQRAAGALNRDQTLPTPSGSGTKSSGGGGFRRRGGGGGFSSSGGGSGATRYTDSEQLHQFVDSIARARTGRDLSNADATEFINYYHGLEAQNSAAYYGGASSTMLDPESQAVAWIESRFSKEAAAGGYGNYFEAFVKAVQSGAFSINQSEGT